jgi:hypothetical protein
LANFCLELEGRAERQAGDYALLTTPLVYPEISIIQILFNKAYVNFTGMCSDYSYIPP